MSNITIEKISIVDLNTEAVVNAANDGLWAGSGVCGAIFEAAGHSQLQAACEKIGHCDVGSAVITPGFNLKAKYIIHAVGPYWHGGNHNEPQLLYGAYNNSLELALKYGCRSIGFPLISAGVFGYPVVKAWRKAIQACFDFINKHNEYEIDVVFAVLDNNILNAGINALNEIAPQLRCASRGDWETKEMPPQYDTFKLQRSFTRQEMAALRRGNIPQAMEDKWFWYMEGNTLYAHRSWTGFCIYILKFNSERNEIDVTVNRDPKQYSSTSIEEDTACLNDLLDWWCKPSYDHHGQWLAETVHTLQMNDALPKMDQLIFGSRQVDAIYFHKPEEPYGFLSNWYLSPFDIDGWTFSSAEQYLMFRKCSILGDNEAAKQVMSTDDPAEQQKIARHAKGYNNTVWDGICQVVAMRGLWAKFSQHDDLKKQLLSTGDAYLVECAKSDFRWACGVGLYDEARFDVANWKGRNILGFALMEIRNQLR